MVKDAQKAYGKDFKGYDDLLGYERKQTTKEKALEWVDWATTNLDLLSELTSADRQSMMENTGMNSSKDPYIQELVRRILNINFTDIEEVRQWIVENYKKLTQTHTDSTPIPQDMLLLPPSKIIDFADKPRISENTTID